VSDVPSTQALEERLLVFGKELSEKPDSVPSGAKRDEVRMAKANRERLAVAHHNVVMREEAEKAVDVRQNMERLKELRLAKQEQEARTEISRANQRPATS
jgi:hypothetical protein